MSIHRVACLVGAVFILLASAMASAKELTVKDVLEFKQMNFSDDEIIAEIVKSGSKFNLTDQDIEALKAAKAGDALIRAMKNPPRKITLDDVSKMVKDGKGDEEILDAIAASPQRPKATIGDIRDFRENKASMAVILAVKGTPLGVADLKLLAENGAKGPVHEKLADILGFQDQPVGLADVKALMDAGVPKAVVTKLKEAGDAKVAVRNTKPEKVEPPKTKDDTTIKKVDEPQDDLHPADFVGIWNGTAVSNLVGESAVVMVLRTDGTYSLRIGAVGQVGKWHVLVDAATFTWEPSPGMPESHPYTLDGSKSKLTIEAQTGKLILTKQMR